MKATHIAAIGGLATAGMLLGWLLFVMLPTRYAAPAESTDTISSQEGLAPLAGPKISAKLFFVADDGRTLMSVEREVPYAERPDDQARAIITSQLQAPPAPYVSPVPAGTQLRALYLTDTGEAFVDLSSEVVTAHPGGSTYERLTVYALVNALTANLPAVHAVQLLVDGREVETLAGHIDLRAPLAQRLERPSEMDETTGPVGIPESDTTETGSPGNQDSR